MNSSFARVTVVMVTFLLLGATPAAVAAHQKQFSVMPWMCLERCGFNSSQVMDHVATLKRHRHIIHRVAYHWMDLQADGTFSSPGWTDVGPALREFGVETYGMLTSWSLPGIRQVIYNTTAATQLVTNLARAAVREGMAGINFDWEPMHQPANATDAKHLADFFVLARKVAFHATNGSSLKMTLCISTWNHIWNYSELSHAMTVQPGTSEGNSAGPTWFPTGELMTMNTYTANDKAFTSGLHMSIRDIANTTLVVGLYSHNNHDPLQKMNSTEVAFRMGALAVEGICRIAIWATPLPEWWWPQLEQFKERCLQ